MVFVAPDLKYTPKLSAYNRIAYTNIFIVEQALSTIYCRTYTYTIHECKKKITINDENLASILLIYYLIIINIMILVLLMEHL